MGSEEDPVKRTQVVDACARNISHNVRCMSVGVSPLKILKLTLPFCLESFCKKFLRLAADKCGKRCPKCRQLMSNGRFCTMNTVLWNTIQLLFPQVVEARKAAGALNSHEEAT